MTHLTLSTGKPATYSAGVSPQGFESLFSLNPLTNSYRIVWRAEPTGGFRHWQAITYAGTGEQLTVEDLEDCQLRMMCCFVISAMPRAALPDIQEFLAETWEDFTSPQTICLPENNAKKSFSGKVQVKPRAAIRFPDE